MNNGFFRVELATPVLIAGGLESNFEAVCEAIGNAVRRKSDMIVLPRMCLTGVVLDIGIHTTILKKATEYLNKVVAFLYESDIIALIPTIVEYENSMIECVAVVQQGEVLGLSCNASTVELASTIKLFENPIFERPITIGKHLYRVNNDFCFAITGGDSDENTHINIFECVMAGANLIVNIQSTHALAYSFDNACKSIANLSKYTSTIIAHIANNPKDLAYGNVSSGNKIICECGEILRASTLDKADSVFADVDTEYIQYMARRANKKALKKTTKNQLNDNYYTVDRITSPDIERDLQRVFEKSPFVALDNQNENILEMLTLGIYTKMREIGTDKIIFGLSGGLDSSFVLLVCDRLCKKFDIDNKNIFVVTMRGFGTGSRSENNAKILAKELGTTHLDINITAAVTQHLKDIGHNAIDVTYENAQARERAKILLDLANKYGALLLGTGDLSEIALGWSTYGGDQLAQFNPNSGLSKSQIKALVAYLSKQSKNQLVKDTLNDIVVSPISPELVAGQKTESILGPYELHEFFLYHFVTRGSDICKIYYLTCKTFAEYKKSEIKKYLKIFIQRFFANQFKRKYACDGIQIFENDLTHYELNSNINVGVFLKELENC